MPYKIEDLRAPGMDQNFRTLEGKVSQPAINELSAELPVKEVLPRAPKLSKKSKHKGRCSNMREKAKDILFVVLMFLCGVVAIALVVRGIQFLFSI